MFQALLFYRAYKDGKQRLKDKADQFHLMFTQVNYFNELRLYAENRAVRNKKRSLMYEVICTVDT